MLIRIVRITRPLTLYNVHSRLRRPLSFSTRPLQLLQNSSKLVASIRQLHITTATTSTTTIPTTDVPKVDSVPDPIKNRKSDGSSSKEQRNSRKRWPAYIRLTILAIKLFFVGHLLITHVGFITGSYGGSMLPTFPAHMLPVVISSMHAWGRGVKVGDVVAFSHPLYPGEKAAKRITGMPGDFVVVDPLAKDVLMMEVPEGHCYVMGDNLSHSRDSRDYGPIPLALISGKVVAILWPPKILENPLKKISK